MIVNEGTTLTLNNNKSRALMSQGNEASEVLVKAGGTLIVTGNGADWSKADDETMYYAEKSAITIGVYGWHDGYGIMTYRKALATFEDGADVDISNNYVRGISSWGTVYIGEGTRIVNNGMLDSGDRDSCRVATGGGIYNAGTMTIADGVELYNNHANTSADDIYNAVKTGSRPAERGNLTFGRTSSDWYLDGEPDCTHKISGWFDDAADSRWEVHTEPYHLVEVQPENYTDIRAIKAAHGIRYVVSYDLQGGTHQGSPTVEDESYSAGDGVTVITDPVREDYVFTGWTVTVDNTEVAVPNIADGGFAMPGANVLLTANWKLQETTPDPTPDTNRPSGGGSGGGSGGPNTNTSTPSGGPGVPNVEIAPEPVPLAVLPENSPQTELVIIEGEEVPLAPLPKTGDRTRGMEWLLVLSGSLLATCIMFGKKREEEQ